MTTHYRGYRIASSRKPGWDYGRPSWYLVTICTRNRIHALAAVEDGALIATSVGCLAGDCWLRTGILHPNVGLDAWVVMPDHFHGLIRPTGRSSPRREGGPGMPTPAPWRSGTLGVLINQFKRAVTLEARLRGLPWPGWQSRFHDRIIRDEAALRRTRRYIAMNPAKYLAAHGAGLRSQRPE